MMDTPDHTNLVADKLDIWENEGGAVPQKDSLFGDRFVTFERSNGSKVACQVANIQFLATGENGSVLHFGGGSQVNVSQSFEDVLALLNSQT